MIGKVLSSLSPSFMAITETEVAITYLNVKTVCVIIKCKSDHIIIQMSMNNVLYP